MCIELNGAHSYPEGPEPELAGERLDWMRAVVSGVGVKVTGKLMGEGYELSGNSASFLALVMNHVLAFTSNFSKLLYGVRYLRR